MTSKDLQKDFNIPARIKGDTPAEKAEYTEKLYKERPFDVETKEEILASIANWQEYQKMQEALATESQETPDLMGGEIPEGMENFIEPNELNQYAGGATGLGALMGKVNPYLMAAQMGVEAIGGVANAIGQNNIDTSGKQLMSEKGMGVGQAISGFMNPTQAPGTLVSLLTQGGRKNKIQENNTNAYLAMNAGNSDTYFMYGGNMNKYADGETGINPFSFLKLNPPETTIPEVAAPETLGDLHNVVAGDDAYKYYGLTTEPYDSPIGTITPSPVRGQGFNDVAKGVGGFLKDNWQEIGRTAPLLANLFQRIDRAPNPRRQRITGKITPNLINEEAVLSPMRDAVKTGMNALRGVAGGDKAALQAGLIGASTAGTKALGERSMAVQQANQAERGRAQQLDFNRLLANQRADFMDVQDAQANEGAYNSAKIAKRNAFFEDLGALFKEQGDKKLVKEMFGYSWDGQYFRDSAGNIVMGQSGEPMTQEEMQKQVAAVTQSGGADAGGKSSGTKNKRIPVEKITNLPAAPAAIDVNATPDTPGAVEITQANDAGPFGDITIDTGRGVPQINLVPEKDPLEGVDTTIDNGRSIPEINLKPSEPAKDPLEGVNENIDTGRSVPEINLVEATTKELEDTPKEEIETAVQETAVTPQGAEQAMEQIEKIDPESVKNPVTFAMKYLGLDEENETQQETIKGFFDSFNPNFISDPSEVTKDEKAWCAAFVNHVLQNFDVDMSKVHTNRNKDPYNYGRARQYMYLGEEVKGFTEAKPGDLVITQHANEDGDIGYHVGFFSGMSGDAATMLGGNQNNRVSVREIKLDKDNKVVGIRRVKDFESIPEEINKQLFNPKYYDSMLDEEDDTTR